MLAQRARLAEVEQAVFGDAVLAYMNVVRDEAELELQINNEQVLVRQLQATRDRFEVGEVTRTDVAQAEIAPCAGNGRAHRSRGRAQRVARVL